MGHLDPFLQDLNGIGIIAMMVGISAVIVRVVFCKTMRDRIYTGVGGLISAIVMSLGIDYAIRPFAGTGESTATNGLGVRPAHDRCGYRAYRRCRFARHPES